MALAVALLLAVPAPVLALGEGLQCVPYARQLTGIQIYGDAHSWWDQAEGRYARGATPEVGAVMAFRAHGNMRLGHVAAVSKILDNRHLLISHANWSIFDGTRGHVENDVLVIDASPDNDWSEVRVWYGTNQAMGSTQWPLAGFIYPRAPGEGRTPASLFAARQPAVPSIAGRAPDRALFGNSFRTEMARAAAKEAGLPQRQAMAKKPEQRQAPQQQVFAERNGDPIGDLIGRTLR
jgi:hypothetical protein